MPTPTICQSLFTLPIAERVALADRLYASVPEEWQSETDREWLAEVERRSLEMDESPAAGMTHEAFLAGIQIKRRPA